MFPSLVKIIRIHVKDDSQAVVATTFLDFTLIADNSMNGLKNVIFLAATSKNVKQCYN